MQEKLLSIGEAARQAHMTSETLRHYDRIGLVRPSRVDSHTGYRYYSAQDIVRLNTVHALQQMDLPLQEIKRALQLDDLSQIVAFLGQAEKRADEKIASLRQGKSKIRRARADYERKLNSRHVTTGVVERVFPERTIMLANPVTTVTADDLWSYQRHFYQQLSPERAGAFAFEDLAGVYRSDSSARYFAVCTRHAETDGLLTLPAGAYLCADCTEETRQDVLDALTSEAKARYGAPPSFSLQIVVLTGILQWNYQLQVPAGA